jgi:prepilin-type N-terminal cleavage/methylation domain-containing protein
MTQRKAFTVVELIIAIAVLAIISTLLVINFTQSRQTARDGSRRSDSATLLSAVQQYATAQGTSFITMPGATCTEATATDPGVAFTGAGCTGANGRSYGLMNVAGQTKQGEGASGQSTARQYAGSSIVEALNARGYLNAIPRDPLAGAQTTNPARDYVLIRACPNGSQYVGGSGGQLFAVWARLEGSTSASDFRSFEKLPGSPYILNPSNPGEGILYDFAAGTSSSDATAMRLEYTQTNGYAAGNNPVVATLASASVAGCEVL